MTFPTDLIAHFISYIDGNFPISYGILITDLSQGISP